MTYSIVARDPDTGELGVAVQTCNLAVGTWVPWAEGGVGAVATQSHAERRYGTDGLAAMKAGQRAQQTLDRLLARDPRHEFRQVAMIDRAGGVAVHTGRRCLPQAGHYAGDGFCTQANMMARDTVWGAMAAAFTAAEGDLAERLLVALEAAQAEGGDIRGQQTAALLVVSGEPDPFPRVDLRVDCDPQPLAALRRILRLHRAYAAEYTIPALVEQGNVDEACALLERIAEWAPDQAYLHFLRAYHLSGRLDRWDEGVAVLRQLIAENPIWIEYLRRDAQSDTFDCPGLAEKLLIALNLA